MAKRRLNKEGSIYERDGKFRAQITIDGKRYSKTFKTQKKASAWLRKTQTAVEQDGLTFRGKNLTMQDFFKDWLVVVQASRKKKTYDQYRWLIEKKITPNIGRIKLYDFSSDKIQKFYEFLLKEGCSKHQVHQVHKILRVSLNHAKRMGYITRNPCSAVTPPKPERQEMKFYNSEQVRRFLDTAKALGDRYYNLYFLAIHTGMRQAELLGLQWSDIDWKNETLSVRRQVNHRLGTSGPTFSPPKSKSGYRTIKLSAMAIERLRNQQERVEKYQENAGEDWQIYDMVFPTYTGTPTSASNLRTAYRKIQAASGLPKIRFHDLRHTTATLMLNNGISVLAVAQRLGHGDASLTMNVYGHLIPSKQNEAANLMDQLMQEPEEENATKNCTIIAPLK